MLRAIRYGAEENSPEPDRRQRYMELKSIEGVALQKVRRSISLYAKDIEEFLTWDIMELIEGDELWAVAPRLTQDLIEEAERLRDACTLLLEKLERHRPRPIS